jgi:hypothetical protein
VRGERVRFIRSSDPYTKLANGDEGVITGEDSLGTIHIKWDNGSTLGMIESEGDCFEIIGD